MIEPVEIEWRELAGEVATNVQRQLQEIADASKMTAAGMQQTSVAAEVFKGVGLEHAVEKVVDQFLQFHQRVIAQSTAFHELSQRVNIGVEDYQALRLAGIEAGVSTEQLQTAMVRFQSAIGQA